MVDQIRQRFRACRQRVAYAAWKRAPRFRRMVQDADRDPADTRRVGAILIPVVVVASVAFDLLFRNAQ
jgi:hypothetical protein